MREKIESHWIRSIDGQLTFCGVYEEYYDECAKYWRAENTREQYDQYYNELILPSLEDHNSKAINAYTHEDYETAIQTIAENGRGPQHIPYADATLQKFRHLIEVVVTVAANNGLCDNVLWGSCFSLKEDTSEKLSIKERVKLKKSLTLYEEFAIASKLFSDVKQRGQEMGLLLMYALGLRNNEACAANYGDIRPMFLSPQTEVLWVYKSTITGTNALKSSGKTRNADRIIPIPDVLATFLKQRRAYLEEVITFPDDSDITCIDDLPIVCADSNFFLRCTSEKLTAAGRELFRQIRMDSDKLAFIDRELSDQATSTELKERDPSAYLLRRNFGTHLSILGLSAAEIEYIIGHDIQDMYETRNEFVNETRLLEIKKKLDQRPILNSIAKDTEKKLVPSNRILILDGSGPKTFQFALEDCFLKIHLSTNEPMDPLHLRIHSLDNAELKKQVFQYSVPCQYDRTINILRKYHELYSKK